MDLYRNIIGETIKKFREARDLSQKELAILAFGYEATNCMAGQRKISKIENGKQELHITELFDIARALSIDPQILIAHMIKMHKKQI